MGRLRSWSWNREGRTPRSGRAASRRVAPDGLPWFPPSLAGVCLRYAAMEMAGFSRLPDATAQARMARGSRQHRAFVAELRRRGVLVASETEIVDPVWGVRGRVDAWVHGDGGPVLVEYKSTTRERLDAWLADGRVPVRFYAQIILYLAVSRRRQGLLVVEDDAARRLLVPVAPDPRWTGWVGARVARARSAAGGSLPPREVARHCLTCDRWFHCFANESERDAHVGATPAWQPEPPLPAEPARWQVR